MQTGMHDQHDCTNYEGKIFHACGTPYMVTSSIYG
jgi:hypothetical protein